MATAGAAGSDGETTLMRDEPHLRREEVCTAPGKLCIQFKTPFATIDRVEAYLGRRQRKEV